jgi:hypothetical protein
MSISAHARVLVSNRGDGNWGAGNTNNQIAADGSIYFPHGATAATVPSDSDSLANNFDLSGWETKSSWIVQAELISGTSCTIAVYGMRPTGVEELLVAAVTMNSGAPSFTHGGLDAEVIQGPFSHFRFEMASASGSPVVNGFVIGWNEGDIIT